LAEVLCLSHKKKTQTKKTKKKQRNKKQKKEKNKPRYWLVYNNSGAFTNRTQ
jgi:hypothetical protein